MKKTIERTRRGIEVPPGLRIPEIHSDLTRREFLVGAGLIVLAPSCGSGEEGDGEAPSGETRTVEDFYGSVEVPVDPQRIVILDNSTILATSLRLGVPVVATTFPPTGEGLPPYLDEAGIRDLEDVGWIEVNIERVAELEPDFIIGTTGFIAEEGRYELLREIAPTAAFEMFGFADWKESVRTVGAVFGEEEEIEDAIAGFEGRIEEFKSEMGDRLDDLEVSLVNIRDLNDIRIYTNEWCSGQVLEEAGLGRPASQREFDLEEGTGYVQISLERLPDIDADAIFYFVGSSGEGTEEAEEQTRRIQANPLWQQLEAVQNERAFQVDQGWWFTRGPLEAQNLVLDDLEEYLLDQNNPEGENE